MPVNPTTLKELYEPWKKVEQFFTGGCVHLSPSGLLACSCGEEIKVCRRVLVATTARPSNSGSLTLLESA